MERRLILAHLRIYDYVILQVCRKQGSECVFECESTNHKLVVTALLKALEDGDLAARHAFRISVGTLVRPHLIA